MVTKGENTGSGTQVVPTHTGVGHDQYGTQDERQKVGRKSGRRPPNNDVDLDSRLNGARYTGPDMFQRELMNTPKR